MSLSLSSLLNPFPDADGLDQQASPPSSATHGKDSLPPVSYVQSPEQTYAPQLPPARQGYGDAAATRQEQEQDAPASSTWQWYSQQQRRPGSSGIQLPMPSSDGRKMSSPTLEHYHVPSRSPEQGRALSGQGMTLPPLQRLTSADQMAHASAHEQPQSLAQDAREEAISMRATSPDANPHLAHDGASSPPLQTDQPSPPHLQAASPNIALADMDSSPAAVKQEAAPSPPVSSPLEVRRMSTQQDGDGQLLKAVATLKSEHSALTQSPLRESSVPVPTTETSAPDIANPKKRPAPTKKKGTATMTSKKAPPAKKRKVEPKRSATPSSVTSKTPASKLVSSKGTPAHSSPAPSTRSQSPEADDEPYDDDEDMGEGGSDSGELYCICRKPDTGTFMIGCDGTCDDWFHGKCVGIQERDKNLIDKYICPKCFKAGQGQTSWKRICRRGGCRLPARIGKTKSGKDGSKYCSEECGVQFFRDMVAKSRGRDDSTGNRASRRKSSIVSHERFAMDDDLGARGGVLAAGELKALVTTSKSAEDFKKLGDGVLSPPATPDSKKDSHGDTLTESEATAIQVTAGQKDAAREKHQLLKDRMKFVTMVKQAASRTATDKELKPKEYCGYDSRLEWTDAQFARWRRSALGKQAFELETLATGDVQDGDAEGHDGEFEVCERKKCARHLEWNKLAVDDVRAYMAENSDRMRELDRGERETRARAALRAKAGSLAGEGSVEVHEPPRGLGIFEDGEGRERERPIEQPAVVPTVEAVGDFNALLRTAEAV